MSLSSSSTHELLVLHDNGEPRHTDEEEHEQSEDNVAIVFAQGESHTLERLFLSHDTRRSITEDL